MALNTAIVIINLKQCAKLLQINKKKSSMFLLSPNLNQLSVFTISQQDFS